MDTSTHFPIMIAASFVVFFLVIWLVVGQATLAAQWRTVFMLSLVVVVAGMLFGRYGAQWGLPWWIYYPVPMLANVVLPPFVLKMDFRKTMLYLLLSFLSAPLIHIGFSLLLGWTEYMPFWKL